MKENKYDDPLFFEQYGNMLRSKKGLEGAGEWQELQKMIPDLHGAKMLDLGCGYGWHCRYAIEQGAQAVIGVDISEKMLAKAREINDLPGIEYICSALEDFNYTAEYFDVVLSSLTLHYTASFSEVCDHVSHYLKRGGYFIFSVEHPVFTAEGRQQWVYSKDGKADYWPVDRYFVEGKRVADFLGADVVKYHRTLTSYLGELMKSGFRIAGLKEPFPDEVMLRDIEGMQDELKRPMMLLVSAIKE